MAKPPKTPAAPAPAAQSTAYTAPQNPTPPRHRAPNWASSVLPPCVPRSSSATLPALHTALLKTRQQQPHLNFCGLSPRTSGPSTSRRCFYSCLSVTGSSQLFSPSLSDLLHNQIHQLIWHHNLLHYSLPTD